MGSTNADNFVHGAKVPELKAGVMIIKLTQHFLNVLSGTLDASSPNVIFRYLFFIHPLQRSGMLPFPALVSENFAEMEPHYLYQIARAIRRYIA